MRRVLLPILLAAAIVAVAPDAHGEHGSSLWSGQWKTTTTGMALRLVTDEDGREFNRLYLQNKVKCPSGDYIFGYYYPAPHPGRIMGCTHGNPRHLEGRWSSNDKKNGKPVDTGFFEIDLVRSVAVTFRIEPQAGLHRQEEGGSIRGTSDLQGKGVLVGDAYGRLTPHAGQPIRLEHTDNVSIVNGGGTLSMTLEVTTASYVKKATGGLLTLSVQVVRSNDRECPAGQRGRVVLERQPQGWWKAETAFCKHRDSYGALRSSAGYATAYEGQPPTEDDPEPLRFKGRFKPDGGKWYPWQGQFSRHFGDDRCCENEKVRVTFGIYARGVRHVSPPLLAATEGKGTVAGRDSGRLVPRRGYRITLTNTVSPPSGDGITNLLSLTVVSGRYARDSSQATLTLSVKVASSNEAACPAGRTGQVQLIDKAGPLGTPGSDQFRLELCGRVETATAPLFGLVIPGPPFHMDYKEEK